MCIRDRVNTVREKNVHLVGLSALMTTTLKSMEETIAALHEGGSWWIFPRHSAR